MEECGLSDLVTCDLGSEDVIWASQMGEQEAQASEAALTPSQSCWPGGALLLV